MSQSQRTMKMGQRADAPGGTVAVVVFDGVSPFHVSVPCAVFGVDRSSAGVPRFEVHVCAKRRGRIKTSADFGLVVQHDYRSLEEAWLVIIPSWPSVSATIDPVLAKALSRVLRRGGKVAGLCLGAFALASAGLLEGREATTHWLATAELATRYPGIRVRSEVLYLDDGGVVTAAGTAAGIDCCLHLLRQRCGAEAASRVARHMVVGPHRPGEQSQYLEMPLGPASSEDAFARALATVIATLERPHHLTSMAREAHMSCRNFTRRFREVVGTSPAKWLTNQRLTLTQRLLETTELSVESIAERAGFQSVVTLRQQFTRAFAMSPRDWRSRYRATSSELE